MGRESSKTPGKKPITPVKVQPDKEEFNKGVIDSLQVKVAELEEKFKIIDEENESLVAYNMNLKQENNNVKRKIKETEGQLELIIEEKVQLKVDCKKKDNKNAELEAHKKALKLEIAELREVQNANRRLKATSKPASSQNLKANIANDNKKKDAKPDAVD